MPDLSLIDFKDIYVTDEAASKQPERYKAALQKFHGIFPGHGDDISIFSAPGRTEIGGNHTDHQKGCVVAASVNLDIIGIVSVNGSDKVRILSEGLRMIEVDLSDLSAREEFGSTALTRGMLFYLKEEGFLLGGFDAYMTSDVLSGSGLSSSASFETLIGTIVSGLFNDMKIPSVTIAKAGQKAENIYFGKPCGLMDQCACATGGLVGIDFEDPSSPEITKIDPFFEEEGFDLCITDTRGSHAELTGEYAAVGSEMRAVASLLGHEDLCKVTFEEITDNISLLRQKAGDRAVLRAIHFVNETKRAKLQAKALAERDMKTFLRLVRKSGDSSYKYLQNVYVASEPMSQPVALALAVSDTVLEDDEACRVHGGGFAGTIQAFVKKENTKRYKETMENVFGQGSCLVLSVRRYGGIKVL